MNIEKVKKLIENGESLTIEYKASIAECDKLGKALSGMLNADGGYGLIGISDSGKIVGIEVTDTTKKKLTSFQNAFDPYPSFTINFVEVPDSDKFIVVIHCTPNLDEPPYTYKSRAYQKTLAGLETMPVKQYQQKLLEHAALSKIWETLPANGYTMDELDDDEIVRTMKIALQTKRIGPDEYTENVRDILAQFDLIHNNKINHAAMILFAKKIPMDGYSQCFIRMGRFIDDTMDETLDSQHFRGNAFQIIRQAEEFVNRHLPIASRFAPNQFERIDERALPLEAVREAIINAVCHRDYSKPGADIQLLIFNDYLEIHNVGRLYGGTTLDELKRHHPSRRRNERIAQVFHMRKLIESFGGGTRRIYRLCDENGLKPPEMAEECDGFVIRFFFKEPIGPLKQSTNKNIATKNNLSFRAKRIISIMQTLGECTSTQILSKMDEPLNERTLRRELAKLEGQGIVVRIGETSMTTWSLVS